MVTNHALPQIKANAAGAAQPGCHRFHRHHGAEASGEGRLLRVGEVQVR